jgi:transposase
LRIRKIATKWVAIGLSPERPRVSLTYLLAARIAPASRDDRSLAGRRAAGAQIHYLPAYSPDLNPIEMAFAKLKAWLRKTAARTVADLWQAIAAALDAFIPQECEHYLAACGYGCD